MKEVFVFGEVAIILLGILYLAAVALWDRYR